MQTIEERITDLMRGDYDPLRPDNLAETMANLTTEKVKMLSGMMCNSDCGPASEFIIMLSKAHWSRLARIQAQCDEENELLAHADKITTELPE